jgi:hypothetical protein
VVLCDGSDKKKRAKIYFIALKNAKYNLCDNLKAFWTAPTKKKDLMIKYFTGT